MKSSSCYWAFLFVITFLFLILSFLTPYFSDDWHFGFMIGENRDIESFRDVLVSNYRHYIETNGRAVCHVVLMTFAGLLGKSAFNVFNAFLLAAFLHLLAVNFSPLKEDRIKVVSISSFLVFILMCGFKYTFLWMSGVMNYEMVAVLLLLFYYLLNRTITSKWVLPLLFLYGIITGWTNEALLVGFCLGIAAVYIKQIKSLTASQWCLLVGLAIGACLCVFSPGSINRALGDTANKSSSVSLVQFFSNWASSLFYMKNLRLFWLMLVGLLLTRRFKTLWLVAALTSFIFVSLTGFHNENSRFGIELFSLIIILQMIPWQKLSRYVLLSFASLSVCYLLACMPFCYWNFQEMGRVETQILSTENGLILTNEVKPPFWAKRMVLPFTFAEDDDYFCSFDCESGDSKNIARYFGCKSALTFLPEYFVDDAIGNRIGKMCDVDAGYPFYACELSAEVSVRSIKMKIEPSPFSQFPLLNRMAQFTVTSLDVDRYSQVQIGNKYYLLIPKHPLLHTRTKAIIIE